MGVCESQCRLSGSSLDSSEEGSLENDAKGQDNAFHHTDSTGNTTIVAATPETQSGLNADGPSPSDTPTSMGPSDVLITGEIGRGLVTVTYAGTFTKTGEKVAIKRPVRYALPPSTDCAARDGQAEKAEDHLKMWRDEVNLMVAVGPHPDLCRFIGACLESASSMFLCYEFLGGGSLSARILDVSLPIDGLRIALEVSSGMKHLHSKEVLHRDLKSGNIMLDAQGHAKICDFGLSCFVRQDGEQTAETGTYRWMAPEVIRHEKYSFSADVYSYGIMLWEVFARAKPYADLTPIQAAYGVAKKNLRPTIPESVSPAMSHLMTRCWAKNPAQRPTFAEIHQLLSTGGVDETV